MAKAKTLYVVTGGPKIQQLARLTIDAGCQGEILENALVECVQKISCCYLSTEIYERKDGETDFVSKWGDDLGFLICGVSKTKGSERIASGEATKIGDSDFCGECYLLRDFVVRLSAVVVEIPETARGPFNVGEELEILYDYTKGVGIVTRMESRVVDLSEDMPELEIQQSSCDSGLVPKISWGDSGLPKQIRDSNLIGEFYPRILYKKPMSARAMQWNLSNSLMLLD